MQQTIISCIPKDDIKTNVVKIEFQYYFLVSFLNNHLQLLQ